MSEPLRLGALISGGGRTLMNILDRIDEGSLRASVERVISSRADVTGVKLAKQRGLDVRIAARRDFAAEHDMHDAITAWLVEGRVDLVCLCGYLRWLRVDEPFQDRVLNIHPALLPDFGGKGMYGLSVHRAVLKSRRRISGCTVHFVDDQYDHGPIILQRVCPVVPDDDAHSLAARVFEEECLAYPEVIRMFADGRLQLVNGRAQISANTE
ncbi:MAG: phosphoribosylglycinamide formyltransferase [Planctomycetes bacterium]|nr:phosphoribosylglycinamide formyltransferase [Planctomycetota bacterium]